MTAAARRSIATSWVAVLIHFAAGIPAVEAADTAEPVRLVWPTVAGATVAYDAYVTQETAPAGVPLDDETWEELIDQIDGDALSGDARSLVVSLAERLHAMPLPRDRRSLLRVCGAPDSRGVTIEMTGADPGPPPGPDASDAEREEHIFRKLEAGILQLWMKLDASGDVQSFYLPQTQKNIAALFFALPGEPVREGDVWGIPTQLVQLDQRFVPASEAQTSKARLVSLSRDSEGRQHADLLYVVRHRVTGMTRASPGVEAGPFALEARYLAAATFDVANGSWERYTGELVVTSSGAVDGTGRQLHALRPLPRGADSRDASEPAPCGEPTASLPTRVPEEGF